MHTKFMVLAAVGLVALSAGVPSMLGGGDPPPPVHHGATLSVEVEPGDAFGGGFVVATLALDPRAPVVEVSLGSDDLDFEFVQSGQSDPDGRRRWVAEAPLLHDVDCYAVDAEVTLATVHAAPAVAATKVKKAKKVKVKKAKKYAAAANAGKAKKVKVKKAKKSKHVQAAVESVFGATVLNLTAESCIVQHCPEIMN